MKPRDRFLLWVVALGLAPLAVWLLGLITGLACKLFKVGYLFFNP